MKIDKAIELALEGLHVDGAHHKQWYLEQILKRLGVDLEKEYELASDIDEEWERGIAP